MAEFNKQFFIKDLYEGLVISNELFGIAEIKQGTDRNGNTYFDLRLIDNSGEISAKIWSELASKIKPGKDLVLGGVVAVDAEVGSFRGSLQMSVRSVRQISEGDFSYSDIVKTSSRSKAESMAIINTYVEKVNDSDYKKVIKMILSDFEDEFYSGVAATVNHHQYLGGLADHTIEMLGLADKLCEFYEDVDTDIVYSSIILHDFCKIFEITKVGFAKNYSVAGKLIGHIVFSVELLDYYLIKHTDIQLSELLGNTKWTLVKHAILAHHGKQEHGSPVIPMTREAQIVSVVDDASWEARAFDRVYNNANSNNDLQSHGRQDLNSIQSADVFSSNDFALSRKIYLGGIEDKKSYFNSNKKSSDGDYGKDSANENDEDFRLV
jgi:3'-5' exoribonuclease